MLIKAWPASLTGLGDAVYDNSSGESSNPAPSGPDTIFTTVDYAGPGFDWSGFLNNLVGTGAKVATTALQSGHTVIQYPNGAQIQVPPGQPIPSTLFGLGGSGSTSSSGLLIIGLVAVAVVMMTKGGRG